MCGPDVLSGLFYTWIIWYEENLITFFHWNRKSCFFGLR